MVDMQELLKAANAAAWERKHRGDMWSLAEEHMRLAGENHSRAESQLAFAASDGCSADAKSRHEALAPLFRAIGLLHLRIAKEYARASGLDVSGIEIPNE